MQRPAALGLAASAAILLASGCAAHRADAARPAPASAPVPAAAPAPPALVNPNQEANDRQVAKILKEIAGREKEPAEKVFRNMQLPRLQGAPAERVLRVMNFGYSRALGVACTHCHVEADFASDDKRPKRAAREMVAMNDLINERLKAIEALERPPQERFVNCTTCHRGALDPAAADR